MVSLPQALASVSRFRMNSDINLVGAGLLLGAAAFWLAVAAFAGGGARFRDTAGPFGAGMLAFPLALLAQKMALLGYEPASLPAWTGAAAVLLIVGPSEELCKAAMAALSVRSRLEGEDLPGATRRALMAGIAAASGYAFLEHLGRFLNPATPGIVLLSKAFLGTALHTMLSPLWSAGLVEGRAALLKGVLLAGAIHGAYNAGSFLPAWTGAPLEVALLWQTAVVAALTPFFLGRLGQLPGNGPGPSGTLDSGGGVELECGD